MSKYDDNVFNDDEELEGFMPKDGEEFEPVVGITMQS